MSADRMNARGAYEPMLIWAACPVCNETWSEAIPDVGYRTYDLSLVVKDDLGSMANRCRATHSTVVQVGFVGEMPAPPFDASDDLGAVGGAE